jgi:hypothetical protein
MLTLPWHLILPSHLSEVGAALYSILHVFCWIMIVTNTLLLCHLIYPACKVRRYGQTDGQHHIITCPITDARMTRRLSKSERAPLRSKVRGSKSWYQMKGLSRRHVIYERPSTYQSKAMAKVDLLEKKVYLTFHGQKSECQTHSIKWKVLPEGIQRVK